MPTKDIAAIILAAGKGTRMKSPLPKVLHEVAGWSLLRHAMSAALALKPVRVMTVVGENMEAVQAEARAVYSDVECVVQEKQLGTGHAVRQAMPKLKTFKGTVLVLYADTPLIRPETLKKLVASLEKQKAAVAVLGFEAGDAAEYGRLVTEGGNLLEIVEHKDATAEQRALTLCNSGVMAISGAKATELLGALTNKNAKGEYYLTDVVKIARGKDYGYTWVRAEEAEVLGVNSQAERAAAETRMQEHMRREAMAGGVMLVAPETVFFAADTKLATGVKVEPYVVFGVGVKVEAGVEIRAFSHITGAHIRKNAVVGPFARLRPGADIGEDAKIGNFVEIKQAKLHKGVKASHLTYIGDAEIGAESNLGAGTVTCNYDGYNKHRTEIGAEVFIGSNTSLVAPVKIGDGAIVGAGSTITKDVDPDARAINKMPQENTPGRGGAIRKLQEKKAGAKGKNYL